VLLRLRTSVGFPREVSERKLICANMWRRMAGFRSCKCGRVVRIGRFGSGTVSTYRQTYSTYVLAKEPPHQLCSGGGGARALCNLPYSVLTYFCMWVDKVQEEEGVP
jgi:hypothetical protein